MGLKGREGEREHICPRGRNVDSWREERRGRRRVSRLPSSGRSLEEASGVLPHAVGHTRQRDGTHEGRSSASVGRNEEGGGAGPVHLPVLQKVLGVLNLVLRPRDGDDAVLRAL